LKALKLEIRNHLIVKLVLSIILYSIFILLFFLFFFLFLYLGEFNFCRDVEAVQKMTEFRPSYIFLLYYYYYFRIFLPPEMVTGEVATRKTDVYSLAIIMIEYTNLKNSLRDLVFIIYLYIFFLIFFFLLLLFL
jgi:hypothetical protein